MKRREALKMMAALPLFSTQPKVKFFGAIPSQSQRYSFPTVFGHFTGISQGKKALLWKYFELATKGPLEPHNQTNKPDCVAQAAALTCDILAACDIHMRNEPERWVAKANVEMIYEGSRQEIGANQLKLRPGSSGEWCSKWVNEYGILHRLPYSAEGHYLNLMEHKPKNYGNNGVPDWLESIAKKHRIATYTKATNFREACDAMYVGQPLLLCCSYAFPDKRDGQGFSKPKLGHRREKWFHAWCLAGFDDTGQRPGGLLINSHGLWNSGPKRHGQPNGSHWVDAEYLDLLIREWEDCYALSAYVGHPQRMLNHKLY